MNPYTPLPDTPINNELEILRKALPFTNVNVQNCYMVYRFVNYVHKEIVEHLNNKIKELNLNLIAKGNYLTKTVLVKGIDVELSELETKWLDRLKKYMYDYKHDYVCSWWLRIEYENESITTTKINYILSKLVAKGILKKQTTRSYTKFSIIKNQLITSL